jgi:hypothetical protein
LNHFYKIHLSKDYSSLPERIFNLFKEGTVFKLTGADQITADFKTGGLFELRFLNRGIIKGSFSEIIQDKKIILLWDVEGFNLQPETGTIVTILIHSKKPGCTLELYHDKIKQSESASRKTKAWKEILDALKK